MKMRAALAVLTAVNFLATGGAPAQDVRYDFTGTYPDTATSTALTAPGGAFTFDFLVPESVPDDSPDNAPFYLSAPVLSGFYAFKGKVIPVTSGDYLHSDSDYNSTYIDLNTPVTDINLFYYDGSGGLVGRPDASGQSHFVTGDLGPDVVTSITFTPPGAERFTIAADYVNESRVGTPVPEPTSMALAAVGLICCGGMALARREKGLLPT